MSLARGKGADGLGISPCFVPMLTSLLSKEVLDEDSVMIGDEEDEKLQKRR